MFAVVSALSLIILYGEFINRVNVHEADKSNGGRRTQQVDVYLNFIGNFNVPEDFDELTPAERADVNAERERRDRKNAYERERLKKKRESDWHKQDSAKKKEMREAIAAKDESKLTEDEIAFIAKDAEKTERRKAYMREYGHNRYLKNKQAKAAKAETEISETTSDVSDITNIASQASA